MYSTLEIPSGLSPLADINQVQQLSASDKPLIDELAEVLRKHNAINRFGITLLHQHFEISDDEILLEETDVLTRTQTIRPILKKEVAKLDPIQTSWRLDYGAAIQMCVCTRDSTGYHVKHTVI